VIVSEWYGIKCNNPINNTSIPRLTSLWCRSRLIIHTAMSTRLRDENAVHAHHHGQLKKQQITKKSNENSSITRPTLASSAKVKPGKSPPSLIPMGVADIQN